MKEQVGVDLIAIGLNFNTQFFTRADTSYLKPGT
jgi:hypothetical protein